jgi:hypothetical protein
MRLERVIPSEWREERVSSKVFMDGAIQLKVQWF